MGEKSSVVKTQEDLRAGYNLLSNADKTSLLKRFEDEKDTFARGIRVSPGSKVKDATNMMNQVGSLVSSVHLVSFYLSLTIFPA